MTVSTTQDSLLAPARQIDVQPYSGQAKQTLQEELELFGERIGADAAFAHAATERAIPAQGSWAIATANIYTWLKSMAPLQFRRDAQYLGALQFDGHAWGVGLGACDIHTTGWMVDPYVVWGPASFVVNSNPLYTEILFYRGAKPLGVQVGSGLTSHVATALKGTGRFFADSH